MKKIAYLASNSSLLSPGGRAALRSAQEMAKRKPAKVQPSYKVAIKWIIDNEDCEWLESSDPNPSLTACLIADLFDKPVDQVIADLLKIKLCQ